MDIVVTGYAGLCGSIIIYNDKELGLRLKERYSESFFGIFGNNDYVNAYDGGAFVADTMADTVGLLHPVVVSGNCKEEYVRSRAEYSGSSQCKSTNISELDRLYAFYQEEDLAADGRNGGVLAALWRVLKAKRLGGMYALRDIPILQQTVEVCEMYSLNPYRLYAPECRVWISTDTGALAQTAAAAGVPLSVIGFTSKGVAIRRTDTETDSSLRRPEGDELDKVLKMKNTPVL